MTVVSRAPESGARSPRGSRRGLNVEGGSDSRQEVREVYYRVRLLGIVCNLYSYLAEPDVTGGLAIEENGRRLRTRHTVDDRLFEGISSGERDIRVRAEEDRGRISDGTVIIRVGPGPDILYGVNTPPSGKYPSA